jgi:dihydroflavonol-4-reductase
LKHGKTGNCYLLTGHNLTYREFFTLVNKAAGKNRLLIKIPAFVLKGAGLIGSAVAALLHKPVKLTYTAAYLLCLGNYYSGKKAARELQVTFTPIETAIVKALTWFKANNYY